LDASEIQMRTGLAVCRGWASLLAVNGFASCPSPGSQQTCDHPKFKNTTLPSSKKMSGAGYDVVVDVDEEVSAS
jgi:hypothetical protein